MVSARSNLSRETTLHAGAPFPKFVIRRSNL
jgi:hypothetical protein